MKKYLYTLLLALFGIGLMGGCAVTVDEEGPLEEVWEDEPDDEVLDVEVME